MNQSHMPSSSLVRFSGSLALGAITTFAIFAGMHNLIVQDIQRVPPADPFVLINAIMDELTDKHPVARVISPPPEIIAPPPSPEIIPNDSETDKTISIATFTSPNIGNEFTPVTFSLDQQPRPMVRVSPNYPNKAARDGIEGFVTLSFSVNAQGEVEDIEIVNSEPRGIFERDARLALRKWKYQPKLESGTPVAMQGLLVTLDFNLNNN
jgi:protein TonB